MALALTLTDRADGTGIDAVLTGAVPSEAYRLLRGTVALASYGSFDIVETETADGSGEVEFAHDCPAGNYRWYAALAAGGSSTPYQFAAVTAQGDSVHNRCLTAVAEIVSGLGLPTITTNVVTHLVPSGTHLQFPVVVVSPSGTEEERGGTNLQDDVGYPIYIQAADRVPAEDQSRRSRVLHWREKISAALRHRTNRLGYYVPECMDVEIRPDPVVQTDGPTYQYVFAALTAVAVCRVPRG